MQFYSLPFLLVLGVSAFFYYRVKPRNQAVYLSLVSIIFYALWSIPYAVLLFLIAWVVFLVAKRMEYSVENIKYREAMFAVGALLLVLGIFKYAGELAEFFSVDAPFLGMLAPVGISYYTFKLISYVVDVYSGKLVPEKSFAMFFSYVAFFPQILAGPIQRAVDFLPQISSPHPPNVSMVTSGLRLILFGIFKKLVIADALSLVVAEGFKEPGSYSGLELLIISYLFAIQLYADFSGITDIAIGSARLFGITIPKNFANPFYAPTIQDFWRRWHMTLTAWLTDYVFLPLRMYMRYWGAIGLAISIFVNMVLIGLWHGASANFILFGILQAVYMIVSVFTLKARDRMFARVPIVLQKLRSLWQPMTVFTCIALSLILFRAQSFREVALFFGGLSTLLHDISLHHLRETLVVTLGDTRLAVVLVGLILMEAIHIGWSVERVKAWMVRLPRALRWSVYYAMIMAIVFFGDQTSRAFIYFQF